MKNKKIQVLRGIAIILVLIIHSGLNEMTAVVIRPFTNYAVALFIFLSGYLTNLEIDNYKKFYKKRIKKVIVPYIIYTIIYSIGYHDILNLFYNLITTDIKGAGHLYYIFVYIIMVLITPIIIKLVNSKYGLLTLLITPISIFFTDYMKIFNTDMTLIFFTNWISYYYLGIFLGNKKITIKEKTMKIIYLMLLITFLLQEMEGFFWYKLGDISLATSQLRITTVFNNYFVMLLVYKYLNSEIELNKIVNEILIKIGDCSFGIYLVHLGVNSIINKVFEILNFNFNFLGVAILSLLISYIGVRIGSKVLKDKAWILGC